MARPLFQRAFWLDSAERSVKSFAQGCLAVIGQDVVGIDKLQATVSSVLLAGAGMAALSILTSIMSAGIASPISPASAMPTE